MPWETVAWVSGGARAQCAAPGRQVSCAASVDSCHSSHVQAGHNLAALPTVVATCLADNVEPQAYMTDILTRLDWTPMSQIESLLPQNWQPRA